MRQFSSVRDEISKTSLFHSKWQAPGNPMWCSLQTPSSFKY